MNEYKQIIQLYNDEKAIRHIDAHYGLGTFEHLMDDIFSIHNKIKNQYRFLDDTNGWYEFSQYQLKNENVIEIIVDGSHLFNGRVELKDGDSEDETSDLQRNFNVAKNVCDLLIEDVNELCSKYFKDFSDNFDFDDNGDLEVKQAELSFIEKQLINRAERRIKSDITIELDAKISILTLQYKKLKSDSRMGIGYKLLHKKEAVIAKYAVSMAKLKMDTYKQNRSYLVDMIDMDVEERFDEIRLVNEDYDINAERYHLSMKHQNRMERLIY